MSGTAMDLNELAKIVETMALQHAYPGFDVRSLHLGLPQNAVKSPARLFVQALKHPNPLVKLVALRWFWERPGDTKRHIVEIAQALDDPDEWVRLEAVRAMGRVEELDEAKAIQISSLLEDVNPEVRKAAAHSCGKLTHPPEKVILALRQAAEDPEIEVRWKAQKALRRLGGYQQA